MSDLTTALAHLLEFAPVPYREAARYITPTIEVAIRAVDPSDEAVRKFTQALNQRTEHA